MHELSIAVAIVDIAAKETAKANKSKVDWIELEIGTLAGIEVDSLNFVWPIAVKDTVLENATKKISLIDGEAKCKDCDSVFKLNHIYDACPTCKSYLKVILKGKELVVKTLEIS